MKDKARSYPQTQTQIQIRNWNWRVAWLLRIIGRLRRAMTAGVLFNVKASSCRLLVDEHHRPDDVRALGSKIKTESGVWISKMAVLLPAWPAAVFFVLAWVRPVVHNTSRRCCHHRRRRCPCAP
jgi:hypothetical protein